MRIAVHKTIDKYHIRIQLANFVGHIDFIDFIRVNVFQIIHLATWQILHDQNTFRGNIPENFRHTQPFVVDEHFGRLLSISTLVQEVQLGWEVFLRFIDQPLHLEIGKYYRHDSTQQFHSLHVDLTVAEHIWMLHLDSNLLSTFQCCTMHLSQ